MKTLVKDQLFTKVLLISNDPEWVKNFVRNLDEICYMPRITLASGIKEFVRKVEVEQLNLDYIPDVIFYDLSSVKEDTSALLKELRKSFLLEELDVFGMIKVKAPVDNQECLQYFTAIVEKCNHMECKVLEFVSTDKI